MAAAPFSVRLKPELKAALEVEAAEADRSVGWVAQKAIEAYVRAKQTKREAIQAALKEAEAGRFVSFEAVSKWVSTWDENEPGPSPKPDVFRPAQS